MSHLPFRPGNRPFLAGVLVMGAAACLFLLPACGTNPDTGEESESMTATPAATPSPVERGEYLVKAGACNDCHTPFTMGTDGPAPDMSRMLSGHPHDMELPPPPSPAGPWIWAGAATNTAFAGPWGISYAANLTPDEETGIGTWTEEWFTASLRTGKHWGSGRQIQPPMPWPWYGKLTDEDLKAIFAYLKSIPPIANQVPDWVPPAAPPGAEGQGGGAPEGN